MTLRNKIEFIQDVMELDFYDVASLVNLSPRDLSITSELNDAAPRKDRVEKLYLAVMHFWIRVDDQCIINELNHSETEDGESLLGLIANDAISVEDFKSSLIDR